MSSPYNVSAARKLTDHYMTIRDLSPTEEIDPIGTNPNPSTEYNPSNDLFSAWYENLSPIPAPIVTQFDQSAYPSNFSQPQTNTSNDYSLSTSAPLIENFSTEFPISSQPRPSISSETPSKRSSSLSKSDSSTLDDDIPVDSSKKKDKKKLGFLHSSKKGKSEKKKNPTSQEVSFDYASLFSLFIFLLIKF